MSFQPKVVWTEGMFLRPQHFQQLERYFDHQLNVRTQVQQGFYWGVHSLTLDEEALQIGKIVLRQAVGVMPDGTPFSIDTQTQPELVLDVPADVRQCRVMLALPMRRSGGQDVSFDGEGESLARYAVVERSLPDRSMEGGESALVQLGVPCWRLKLERDMGPEWVAIPLLRVLERGTDNRLRIDMDYIPPTLAAGRQPRLLRFLQELHGLLASRSEVLAHRVLQSGRGGVAEVADFMMLELINRYAGQTWADLQFPDAHPGQWFRNWTELAGALATYGAAQRRLAEMTPYVHDDMAPGFEALMRELRRLLSTVLEQHAIPIVLADRGQGVSVAEIHDAELLQSADFVLAVHADLPADVLRRRFPAQVKIGPVDRIRDLVHLQLPGIELQALPVVPRELPYNAGYAYYALGKNGDLWRQLERTGAMALHLAGEFPDLRLEFWAIRA